MSKKRKNGNRKKSTAKIQITRKHPPILPDYLEGKAVVKGMSRTNKRFFIKVASLYNKFNTTPLREVNDFGEGTVDFNFMGKSYGTSGLSELKKCMTDIEIEGYLYLHGVTTDGGIDKERYNFYSHTRAIYERYSRYLALKSKNYVFRKALAKVILKAKPSVNENNFPDDFSAYIELPGLSSYVASAFKGSDNEISKAYYEDITRMQMPCGVFVEIIVLDGVKMLSWVMPLNDVLSDAMPSAGDLSEVLKLANDFHSGDSTYLEHNIRRKLTQEAEDSNPDSSQEDIVKIVDKEISAFQADPRLYEVNRSMYEAQMHITTAMLNAILYISGGSGDLNRLVGTDRKKYTSPVSHTTREIVDVGKRFEYTQRKVLAVSRPGKLDVLVQGFWRWQPYGEGRRKTKLIFIDSFVRNKSELTKVIEQTNKQLNTVD